MSHYSIHPTPHGTWQVSEGQATITIHATEQSARHLVAMLDKAKIHNPLNKLTHAQRKLVEIFIALIQGVPMSSLDLSLGDTALAAVQGYVSTHQASSAADQAAVNGKFQAIIDTVTPAPTPDPAPAPDPVPAPA